MWNNRIIIVSFAIARAGFFAGAWIETGGTTK